MVGGNHRRAPQGHGGGLPAGRGAGAEGRERPRGSRAAAAGPYLAAAVTMATAGSDGRAHAPEAPPGGEAGLPPERPMIERLLREANRKSSLESGLSSPVRPQAPSGRGAALAARGSLRRLWPFCPFPTRRAKAEAWHREPGAPALPGGTAYPLSPSRAASGRAALRGLLKGAGSTRAAVPGQGKGRHGGAGACSSMSPEACSGG